VTSVIIPDPRLKCDTVIRIDCTFVDVYQFVKKIVLMTTFLCQYSDVSWVQHSDSVSFSIRQSLSRTVSVPIRTKLGTSKTGKCRN